MDNDKNSTRARNRTVMLTPDLAGQVRSQFVPLSAEGEETEPTIDRGFEPPEVTESFVAKASEQQFNKAIQANDWETPSHSQVLDEHPAATDWSNGSSHEEEPEEYEKKPSIKRKGEQVGYRNSSRSESEEVVWQTLTPLAGFLVSFDRNPLGDYVELRTGRLIVTSEREGSGNYLFIDDPSVSSMHAIMRVSVDGPTQILDQLSDNGTKIVRAVTGEEEMLSGEKSVLYHGDVVIFGERKYHVCLLVGSPTGAK